MTFNEGIVTWKALREKIVLYIIKTQILYKLRVRNPFIINTDIVKSLYFATLDAILLWKVDCLWKL